jgi:hypothetical protein
MDANNGFEISFPKELNLPQQPPDDSVEQFQIFKARPQNAADLSKTRLRCSYNTWCCELQNKSLFFQGFFLL